MKEKLIDDVMAFICEHGIVAQGYVGFRREDAKQLIARIAEGPLPGEKERVAVGSSMSVKVSPYLLVERGDVVIALSGTKEEEK